MPTLHIVVPASFAETHEDFDRWVGTEGAAAGIQLDLIDDNVDVDLTTNAGKLKADRKHGALLDKWIRRIRPDHCLVMVFDDVQTAHSTGR